MVSEKFNHIIRQVVLYRPGAFNIHDDIFVGGVDDDQHGELVLAVVRKADLHSLHYFDKPKFKERKIHFIRHTMFDKGLQITYDKVEAMAAAPNPKNEAAVRSVLCSVLSSFLSKERLTWSNKGSQGHI